MTSIERECRNAASAMVATEYALLDELWYERINYESVAVDYDRETVKEIIRRMPNMLVRGAGLPLDEAADQYGYPDTCALVEALTSYVNKGVKFERYYSELLAERIEELAELADMPF